MSEEREAINIASWLRLLAEQSREHAIVLLDLDGRIVGWNAGAHRIFGYPAAEALGRPVELLFTPEDVERKLHEQELAIARSGIAAEDDRWMLRADGSRFWASGLLMPIVDPSGSPLGFGKVLRNRTDLREQIEVLQGRLEAALDVNRRKDVFLATLSHELRNPLSSIVTATDILRRRCAAAPEAARPLEILDRQLGALRGLVDELLDLARIGSGKLEIRRDRVNLQELVRSAAEAVAPAIESRRHRLELLLPAHPLTVEGDRERLHRVFVNLLENAAKYTPEEGSIWVKGTIEGPEAVLHVQDDGVGIPPELQPRIFELFTQVETSRLSAEGGLGIGLALVREIVAAHGGSIQVRSEGAGAGSDFSVRLPLAAP